MDDRDEGRRRLRHGQRHQPLLRDPRHRAAAGPAARRARVGRDVRADPARRSPSSHQVIAPRPPGPRPHRRHRPADRRPAHGRRHRGAHRPPRARQAGRRRLLARRRRRVLHGGRSTPSKVGKLVMASANIRRDAIPAEMLAQQGQVNAGGGRVHEGHADVPALPAGRAAPGGLPAAARQDRRSRWRRTSTSARRSAASRCRR